MTQQYPSSSTTTAPTFSERVEGWRAHLPRRSRRRLIGGVCGGLAEEWGVAPTLVRLGTLLAALLPGPMWVAYAVAWVLMPDAD
ncbi:PspC domain-containing protein [Actinomyces faecalis]|uniref:PspC domain-containing protein n=1 Tax=Actinomyces faecalis TaxID=2722820 RepID=UPI001554A089|nr:PspC domain-containing protein [Actinomyces faecalis]